MPGKYPLLVATVLVLALSACGKKTEEKSERAPTDAGVSETHHSGQADANASLPDYDSFLSAESRPEADRTDDAARKPAEVLAFMGIKPGWTVLELEAGSGYYTELLSMAVGPSGRVYMQNPAEFDAFLGDTVTNRLANDRLSNVQYLKSPFDEVLLAPETAHVITWILGPHELYFFPENKPEGFGDPAATFAKLHEVLRPNGRLVVLDHAAAPGAPQTTGNTTHRIDPAIIIALAEAAGFEIDKQSDVLANPDDDYEKMVFDPAVRRQTDRFLISFKKAQ